MLVMNYKFDLHAFFFFLSNSDNSLTINIGMLIGAVKQYFYTHKL